MKHSCLVTLVVGTVFVAGCSGSSGSGSAPTITSLTTSKDTIAVGKLETISGDFNFEDTDADLSQISITLKLGGSSTTTPKGNLQGVSGQKSGKAVYAVAIQAPAAGSVELLLTVYDAEGNASNTLEKTLTAQ